MQTEISRKKIKKLLKQLLSTEEGVITILSGALVISDFDDFEMAMDEALKAFNCNKVYFRNLIERSHQKQS